jgi:hypothetical protein
LTHPSHKMNIPIDIPRRINPAIQDPVSKSVVYSFTNRDAYLGDEGYHRYKFPYSKDTYWTNFKYSCYNIETNKPVRLEIGLELKTSDGFTYCVQMLHEREDRKWHHTEWPFPSVYTFGGPAGLYFKVKLPSNMAIYSVNISLLGFMDLFPNVKNYLLLSTLDTYQFVFHKNEDDIENKSIISNVENYDYIRDIIGGACGIRLIARY